uniref:Integrase catalytic domain-containing protein n=1 Tax=Tanacetum cinerariifolium TaxID=118510 RepID=A0A699HAY1_TANCI|nr:hypothetical protein [Tanacetum cinerariifolium]
MELELLLSDASAAFDQIVDFLNTHVIRYALVVNPTIYVSFIRKKVIVTKDVIRQDLRLDNADGVECLPNEEIFTELARRKFNFSKYIFDSMVRNIDSPSKFLMYLRFLQFLINTQVDDLSSHNTKYTSPALTQKDAEEEEDEIPTAPTPPSLTDAHSPVLQDPIPPPLQAQPVAPHATPPQEQPTETSESSMSLLNTLMETCAILLVPLKGLNPQMILLWALKRMHPNREKIKVIDANEDITLVDVETQEEVADMDAKLQGRIDDVTAATKDVNAATKDVNAAEPIVFDDEEPDKDVKEPQKKRVAEETLLYESFKKLKAVEVSSSDSTQETLTNNPKEMTEEDVQNMLEIVIVSEFKVEALQRVVDRGMFVPILGKNDLVPILYLFYTDDAMFIGKWSSSNVNVLMMMLHWFFLVSGLKVNVHKSSLYSLGVHSLNIQSMYNSFGCFANNLLFTYLGVKVAANMASINSWNEVIQKVTNKLTKWKAKSLSVGGSLEDIPSSNKTKIKLRRRNRRVPFEQRNNPPQHLRVVYPPIININYFHHFLDILQNYDLVDDEPMWATDCVVALILGFAITIPETTNEFAIKALFNRLLEEIRTFSQHENESLTDAWLRMKEMLRNYHDHNLSKDDDTCFSIDVIDEILEEDFDALLEEGSKIPHSIKGTILEEEIFSKFDKFIAIAANENYDSKSDEEEPKFEKITINTDYKIKTSLEEPPMNREVKPLPDNLEYVFLEEPSFLPVIISSQLSTQNKGKLVSVLKNIKKHLLGKQQIFLVSAHYFCKHKIQLLDEKKPIFQKQRRLNPNMQEVVKKQIMKLLDTGIIYPIADSPWESVEVFMNDFSVFRNSFDKCLNNLDKMLQRYKDAHHFLNWEKCHFMVKEGIMLGHKVSSAGLEVDKAKIEVISKLSPPTNIKGVRSFLGHAGFYQRFIKDFLKIARPLTKLLEKDTPFEFDDECQKSFELLKEKLTCAPMIVSPNWNLLFELMCDASDFAVGAVLGQKDALKHLFKKQDAKPHLIQWILLLQEFSIEIKDKKGIENVVADHLSRIENNETSNDSEVDDNFPRETLMEINTRDEPLFADFANYLVGLFPKSHKFEYILVAVDYVSKWAEAQALPTKYARVVITFLKKLFCRFRIPKALISDRGTHFCNKIMEKTMKRYGVSHRFSTSYHPQTSGQVENTNGALKRIFEKTVKDNPANWSTKLDDALWAFRTAYKTTTGTTPYKLIYGKNYHLPFKIKHRAYWA